MMIDINTAEVGSRIKLTWDVWPWVVWARDDIIVELRADWPAGFRGQLIRGVHAPLLMVELLEPA